jgi:hypothetical protein
MLQVAVTVGNATLQVATMAGDMALQQLHRDAIAMVDATLELAALQLATFHNIAIYSIVACNVVALLYSDGSAHNATMLCYSDGSAVACDLAGCVATMATLQKLFFIFFYDSWPVQES